MIDLALEELMTDIVIWIYVTRCRYVIIYFICYKTYQFRAYVWLYLGVIEWLLFAQSFCELGAAYSNW